MAFIRKVRTASGATAVQIAEYAVGVADRDELAAWAARLDELGISHTGIRDEKEPMAYSTVVFRDPDNIQLELIAFG